MIEQTITLKSENIRHKLFWILTATIFALLLLYTYFTVTAIVNVAERRRIETEVMDLRTNSVSMELAFIAKEGEITIEKAHNLGFIETTRQFASRDTKAVAVSINHEE